MDTDQYTIITKTELARLKKCEQELLKLNNLWTQAKTTTVDKWATRPDEDQIRDWKSQAIAWKEIVALCCELDGLDVVFPQGSKDTVLTCVKNWIKALHANDIAAVDDLEEEIEDLQAEYKRLSQQLVIEQKLVNTLSTAVDNAMRTLGAARTEVVKTR